MRLLFFEVNEVFDQQHLSRNICVNNGYKILLSFSPKEITLMRSFRSLSRFINADSSRNFTPLRGELSFLFFFSFFFFLLLGGFYGFGKTCIQKAAMRSIVKAKKEYNERSTSRLSTLFLKQSRKEKKSRDERRHESVMDRERVKEETASRGDRERDRWRQERERQRGRQRDRDKGEKREKKERKKREISFQRRAKKQLLSNTSSSLPFVFFLKYFFFNLCFLQHSLFFVLRKLCVSSRHLPKRRRFCLFIPKSDT